MEEDRLLRGKTISSANELPSQEAQLRQALELMGGRRPAAVAASVGSPRSVGTNSPQRHRYVRDGEVPVVHATLGRQSRSPDPALQQDKALIENLRHDLERERALRETAERSLLETRASMTALQTRLAHLEMDLQAAQEHSAAQRALAEASQTLAPDPEPEEAHTPPALRRRMRLARPRREPEPEPVKWWIRGNKV